MKMKKIFAALTAAAMLCGMTACNTDTSSDSGSSNNVALSQSGGKVYKVGVCQLMEHEALGAATDGFSAALKDKLGEENVKIDVQYAQGEVTNCTTLVTNFVAANVDLIMANATPALTAAASATDTIPIVGTSITSYDVAFDYSDWKGKNITGASDLAPLDQQAKMIKDIFPDVKKVGILYCSSEANSKYQADEITKELTALGVDSKIFTVADSNEIQAQTQAAVGECDVLYIPTDNVLADATETVKNIVVPAKIPVVAGEEGICKGCGTVTLSISYYDMGYKAGEMAADILANGKKAGELEVGYSPTTKKYNKEICDALGLTIPSDYTATE